MPTDFRDGKTFPRRGREALGGFLWLPRVFDKARAKAAGTDDGYIFPCPMDRGVMRRWGITPRDFTAAVRQCPSDDDILAWLNQRVTQDRKDAANAWTSRQTFALDRQDAEEDVPGAVAPRSLMRFLPLWLVIAALILVASRFFAHAHH